MFSLNTLSRVLSKFKRSVLMSEQLTSTISPRHGECIWDSHIWNHPDICSDILQTLTQSRPVYIVIDEYKEGRTY